MLTEAVRRRPYSVVLLDEVEKAHPDVHGTLLSGLRQGQLQDDEGNEVDFKNTIILLTSNVGTDTIAQTVRASGGKSTSEELATNIRPELVARFKPALLGRMVVVPYHPLGDAQIRDIVKLKLAKVTRRVKEQHGAELTFAPNVIEVIAQRCTEVDTGARNVDHIVTHAMLPALSEQVLEIVSRGDSLVSAQVSVDASGEFEITVDSVSATPLHRASAPRVARAN